MFLIHGRLLFKQDCFPSCGSFYLVALPYSADDFQSHPVRGKHEGLQIERFLGAKSGSILRSFSPIFCQLGHIWPYWTVRTTRKCDVAVCLRKRGNRFYVQPAISDKCICWFSLILPDFHFFSFLDWPLFQCMTYWFVILILVWLTFFFLWDFDLLNLPTSDILLTQILDPVFWPFFIQRRLELLQS